MRIIWLLLFLAGSYLSLSAQQASSNMLAQSTPQNGFLKNLGQVRDLDNKPVKDVYFQANLGGQQVFITRHGLSILLAKKNKVIKKPGLPVGNTASKGISGANNAYRQDSSFIVSYEMERIDIVLKNAAILPGNIITKVKTSSPLYNLYFDSYQQEQTGIELQSEVLVKNVYPGIDWKVYIKEEVAGQSLIKYDFIVHPGADASLIRLRYSDNARLEQVSEGLTAKGKMGIVKEDNPFSYLEENKSVVPVNFSLKKNELGFKVSPYDKSQTLVIDPSIFWLTYLSSSVEMNYYSIFGEDIETDNAGNIFVQLSAAANTPFPTVNPGNGAYYQDIAAAPNGSMMLLKFAPGGQLLWSTYFGGAKPLTAWEMSIDKFGNIVAVGGFVDLHSPIPLLDNGGYFDPVIKKYFITKFSNTGVLVWSSFYFNFSSYPTDMSFDINGNVYVVGWSEVYDFPVVNPGGGAYVVSNAQYGYAQVLFISQFDASNRLMWSTRIEGNDYDPSARVCTDRLGNIFIGGNARSTNLPLVDAGGYYNTTAWGAAIFRFNAARQLTWSTLLPQAFSVADVTTDNEGSLYVAAGKTIYKFNAGTQLVYEKLFNTPRMYFLNKINYDPYHDQVQVLGVMNDAYYGFPTINTACNGSFFNDGQWPNHTYPNATGPIFATMNRNGDFTYISLVDWVYEYYEVNEMTIDVYGNPIYLFGDQRNGFTMPNPQLTNPGNGAYFNSNCCYLSNSRSALLLKLTASELSVTTEITPPSNCGCNGSVTLTTSCGQAPFTYLWNDGATTSTVAGLCPGDYEVKVTDANKLSRTIKIKVPNPPGSVTAVNKTVVPENCNRSNGSIIIQSVQGGTVPYTYSLDGLSYSSVNQFSNLDSGKYIVRVKDANGCIFNDTMVVPRIAGPSALSFQTTKSTCSADNGQLQVDNVQGGVSPYQYTLGGVGTNSTGIFTALSANSYLLTVADEAGCTVSKSVVIEKTTPATEAIYITGNDHCGQGMGLIQVNNVTGGMAPYTYSTDNASFNPGPLINLTAGSYDLFIKDNNGCVLKKSNILIANEEGPSAIDFTPKQAVCGELTGSLHVNSVQGGSVPYQYALDGGAYTTTTTFSNIQPGGHLLYARDNFGCVYTKDFAIEYVPMVRLKLSPADTLVCYDEMVSLSIRGDQGQVNNISWNIPASGFSTFIKATEAQKIIVDIIDKNNCIIKDTAIINVKACNAPDKCVVIPTAFTPNNDGKNETIGPKTNGCRIEDINFKVYNRWGEIVFESTSLYEKWNGIFKGITQPADVYIYHCVYTTDDKVIRQQKGTLVLVR